MPEIGLTFIYLINERVWQVDDIVCMSVILSESMQIYRICPILIKLGNILFIFRKVLGCLVRVCCCGACFHISFLCSEIFRGSKIIVMYLYHELLYAPRGLTRNKAVLRKANFNNVVISDSIDVRRWKRRGNE